MEYGGCSVVGRTWPRRCAVHCASTSSSAGNVEVPKARILPACTRSERAPRVSSRSVVGSGRCTWYRSIQSVSKRRRLASTARMIQRRDPPRWLGSSLMALKNLVARMTSSRRPLSARPRISSDSPNAYTSAVSTKLTPASSAAWTMARHSSWSRLPHAPSTMVPRQNVLTCMPVGPRVRCSMVPGQARRRRPAERPGNIRCLGQRPGAVDPDGHPGAGLHPIRSRAGAMRGDQRVQSVNSNPAPAWRRRRR